jgi:flagellum-specific ATP synthase
MRVSPELARMLQFRTFNLMDTQWNLGEPFDIVFCRNVMIYFDAPTQRRVLEQMHRAMRPHGLLFAGHSENFSDSRQGLPIIAVIGLVGERGREVQEFIQDDLGAGLARSVVVVATSDEPALMRRQAAWTTLAVAEHFRDQGLDVLCMMDSVTRFAMAQREIGLASGEPPATKGYPPTVFAELPRLLERAGPGLPGQGSITGLFTVLVDGDDHNEPIADAVRGILDGHVVMSRAIAERGRYPAIDILKSVSRTLPAAHGADENTMRIAARRALSTYNDMQEIIRLGAYKPGSNVDVDHAIAVVPEIEALLTQNKQDPGTLNDSFNSLSAILRSSHAEPL